jgi:hypothetical protein
MKCQDCPLKYIGQSGRTFHTRYKEHIQAIKNNNSNSGYSNHILNTEDRKEKKLGKYYVYKVSKHNLQMNVTSMVTHNAIDPIFETSQETSTR